MSPPNSLTRTSPKSPPRSPLGAKSGVGDNVATVDVGKLYRSLTDASENDHRYIIFCQFIHCVFYFDFILCCYLCSVVVEIEQHMLTKADLQSLGLQQRVDNLVNMN